MMNTDKPKSLISAGNLWPFILITSLFMLWGLANNMTDTLLAAFKRIMSMTDFQTSWIQLAFYGAYFCLALPAAIYIRKYTYKSGVLLGLGLFALGGITPENGQALAEAGAAAIAARRRAVAKRDGFFMEYLQCGFRLLDGGGHRRRHIRQ